MSTQDTKTSHALVLKIINQVKRIDMRVAMDITGLANCAVRDNNSNILPLVWTRQSINNEHENASLLTRDILQKHLSGFIEAGVSENLPMLQKVNDPALLVDWVVRTAEQWESRYAQKRDEKYDISQTVLAVMLETIAYHVIPALQLYHENDVTQLMQKLEKNFITLRDDPKINNYHSSISEMIVADHTNAQTQVLESFFWLHRSQHALVRMLFRTGLQVDAVPTSSLDSTNGPSTQHISVSHNIVSSTLISTFSQHICLIAGKLLQKREVCNKAGAYSSQRQRGDVLQEFNKSVLNFQIWLEMSDIHQLFESLYDILDSDTWIFYVIDHTSIPISLTDIHKPSINIANERPSKCPKCHNILNL